MKALALLLLVLSSPAPAGDLSGAIELFRKGNAAYEQGRFEEAAADYQKASDLGVADARLYYNFGNALFRLNRLGPAILYYERARKLAPADEDVLFNLRFAQARVEDKIPEPPPTVFTKIVWSLHAAFSIRAGLWMALVFFSAVFAGFAAAQFLAGFPRYASLATAGISLLALLGLSPSLAYKIHQQETVEYGIVLSPAVEMFSGPGENYQVLTKVHEGTRFEIVESHGEWLSVKLANGKGGFVRTGQLGKV